MSKADFGLLDRADISFYMPTTGGRLEVCKVSDEDLSCALVRLGDLSRREKRPDVQSEIGEIIELIAISISKNNLISRE